LVTKLVAGSSSKCPSADNSLPARTSYYFAREEVLKMLSAHKISPIFLGTYWEFFLSLPPENLKRMTIK
ncbi:MAG: hypothetical protein J6Y33_01190, partial [Prevotella sp.]|nr:hypothetical protein [Prevotella sp.]